MLLLLGISPKLIDFRQQQMQHVFSPGIEGMFQDMEVSKVLAEVFLSSEATEIQKAAEVEFNVSVLTTGRWPSPPPSPEIQLPPALQQLATGWEILGWFC